MSPEQAQTEREEFLRDASRAMGQRQLMLALLNIDRSISDEQLRELLSEFITAHRDLVNSARNLIRASVPNVETGGLTRHIQASHESHVATALAKFPDFFTGASPLLKPKT